MAFKVLSCFMQKIAPLQKFSGGGGEGGGKLENTGYAEHRSRIKI